MNRSKSHLVGLTVALKGIRRSRWLDNFQLIGIPTDGRPLIFRRADVISVPVSTTSQLCNAVFRFWWRWQEATSQLV